VTIGAEIPSLFSLLIPPLPSSPEVRLEGDWLSRPGSISLRFSRPWASPLSFVTLVLISCLGPP